ncbi:hypothetical protein KP509_1Z132400 [Ceratopteris richardii]|nr:hypothetical protein KP509_1Z132400 [Ceratopteris richardii]
MACTYIVFSSVWQGGSSSTYQNATNLKTQKLCQQQEDGTNDSIIGSKATFNIKRKRATQALPTPCCKPFICLGIPYVPRSQGCHMSHTPWIQYVHGTKNQGIPYVPNLDPICPSYV